MASQSEGEEVLQILSEMARKGSVSAAVAHLMPGSEDEGASLFDAYLTAQRSEPRAPLGRLARLPLAH